MCTAREIAREIGLPAPLGAGAAAFWRQVAWREFFHHLLLRHPGAARASLRPALRRVRWAADDAAFEAWRRGETGYPLVDAAMRQLAAEGWIHNRARLVAASFLVKDLLLDWRRGETVFMQGLLDGDPACNNGGWQWVAGTGTDAAPYFRVFSPALQGRRHDPEGTYVRRYVPELRGVPARRIHEPWTLSAQEQRAAGCRIGVDYPAPRVDHAERRAAVLDLYRRALADAQTRERRGARPRRRPPAPASG
jgi:deoxyribodipyrimidine photo-lyase